MTNQPRETFDYLPVFVYGTLRPGEKNYPRYLQGRTCNEQQASVEGHLYFVENGGYPYLEPGQGRVVGTLVEISPALFQKTLGELDALEEYTPADEPHSIYLRRITRVRFENGEETAAWVYYWNCPQIVGKRITSGDFLDRLGASGLPENL